MKRPTTSSAQVKPLVPQAPTSTESSVETVSQSDQAIPDKSSRRRARLRNDGTSSGNIVEQQKGGGGGGGNPAKKSSAYSRSSSYYPQLCFLGFALLLVVADLLYLYKLSSQAFSNDPNHHPSAWKASYLSRVAGGGDRVTAAQRLAPLPTTPAQFEEEGAAAGFHNLDDKGQILKILRQAGMDMDDFDQETLDSLPTWTQVQNLYGTAPRLLGLEKCKEFRDSTDPTVRFFGVAGTFNTGTNLVAQIMSDNCQITERMAVYGSKSTGIRWQVRT